MEKFLSFSYRGMGKICDEREIKID